jgi:tetratricopeptide (TPR) repeat protein
LSWRTALALVLSWGLSLWVTTGVHAQAVDASADAAARAEFEAGRDAYDTGRFTEALAHYERSHALSPRPQLLFNVARAAEADGQPARALDAYRAYLDALPAAENRAFVEGRVAKLQSEAAAPVAETVPAVPPSASAAQPAVDPHTTAALSSTAAPASALAATHGDRDAHEPPKPVWKRGWFWGVIGGAVAAAVITGVAVSLSQQGGPEHAPADERIMTLGAR